MDQVWKNLKMEAVEVELERAKLREELKQAQRTQLKNFDKETRALKSSAICAVNRYVGEVLKSGGTMADITGASTENVE